jgi:hypothetical protein
MDRGRASFLLNYRRTDSNRSLEAVIRAKTREQAVRELINRWTRRGVRITIGTIHNVTNDVEPTA